VTTLCTIANYVRGRHGYYADYGGGNIMIVKKDLKAVTNKKLSKIVKEKSISPASQVSKTGKLASKINGSGWI
jgi:hypothetical protein